jgi:hypothetical protein
MSSWRDPVLDERVDMLLSRVLGSGEAVVQCSMVWYEVASCGKCKQFDCEEQRVFVIG